MTGKRMEKIESKERVWDRRRKEWKKRKKKKEEKRTTWKRMKDRWRVIKKKEENDSKEEVTDRRKEN